MDKIKFYYNISEYTLGGMYLEAWTECEPYTDISVYVDGVSDRLPANQIVVNHDLYANKDSIEYRQIAGDLFKREIGTVKYGYADSVIVELVDDIERVVEDSQTLV